MPAGLKIRRKESHMELIYVIEDDENIRELIRAALVSYGYRVEAFEAAEPALGSLSLIHI